MHSDRILRFLESNDVKFYEYADMSGITSIKCGEKARFLAEPRDIQQLIELVRYLYSEGVEYRVIGGMTNTLPPEGDYDGVLIRTSRIAKVIFTDNNRVLAETGAALASIVREANARGIGGFSDLVGIPGTLGGAIFGNAGAHSRSISDTVISVTAYDPEKDAVLTVPADMIGFAYRDSFFRRTPRCVILSAELFGEAADSEDLISRSRERIEARKARQPLSDPSLGSIFKHPPCDFAPKIIEELGLKGCSAGGASVSEKHAGFIINRGGATVSDVKRLMEYIKDEVYRVRGISLEEEINIM